MRCQGSLESDRVVGFCIVVGRGLAVFVARGLCLEVLECRGMRATRAFG